MWPDSILREEEYVSPTQVVDVTIDGCGKPRTHVHRAKIGLASEVTSA